MNIQDGITNRNAGEHMTRLEIFIELIETHKGLTLGFLICLVSFLIECLFVKFSFQGKAYLTCFLLFNGSVITLKILVNILNTFGKYLEELKESNKEY